MSSTIAEKIARLRSLAAGLAQEAGIAIEVREAPTWSWNVQSQTLVVARGSLNDFDPEQCAALVAHEIGHHLISRYPFFDRSDWPTPLATDVLNALEDPRVEAFMVARFPGVAAWLESLHHAHAAQDVQVPASWVRQFGFGCVTEPVDGWHPGRASLAPEVGEVLDRTRNARQVYAQTWPPPDLVGSAWATRAVDPAPEMRLVRKPPQFGTERENRVLASAWQAFQSASQRVIPEVMPLYERDVVTLARALDEYPSFMATALHALALSAEITQSLVQAGLALALPAKPVTGKARAISVRMLAMDVRLQRNPRFPLKEIPVHASNPSVRGPQKGQVGRTSPRVAFDYHHAVATHAAAISGLVHDIEEVLEPRRNPRYQPGYSSGRRIDLRRLATLEMDPTEYQRLWMRRNSPEVHDLAVHLLVDLSGSMSLRAKAQAAFEGLVIMTEVLQRVGVRWAVSGFQDVLIPIADFDEGITRPVRQRIESIRLEVVGENPGGRNRPLFNDDGPAVLEAAARLAGLETSQRLLVVVSDGRPEGRHSGESDLRAAVREVTAAGIHLVGVGLGPRTRHVEEYYPHYLAEVPVAQFPQQMGQLLKQLLLNR